MAASKTLRTTAAFQRKYISILLFTMAWTHVRYSSVTLPPLLLSLTCDGIQIKSHILILTCFPCSKCFKAFSCESALNRIKETLSMHFLVICVLKYFEREDIWIGIWEFIKIKSFSLAAASALDFKKHCQGTQKVRALADGNWPWLLISSKTNILTNTAVPFLFLTSKYT